MDQTTLTLTAGGVTGTITATVLPADATNKTVTWTSSNEAVATVAGGVVTPLTAGTTTITATTVDGSKTATCKVVVIGAGDKVVNITNYGVYETIQLAIAAAVDGDTIVLGSNTTVTETVRITSGQSITLDLNGKTVSSTLATTFRLEEGALNVVDTADVKGGISVNGEAFRVNGQGNSLATDAILNIGTGVNVTSSGDCCVFIYGKATLNTAGTLLSQGQYAPLMGNGTSASDGTVINITGGSITTDGTVTATGRKTTGVYFPQDGILTISGGTISSGGTAVEVKGGTVSITGGTIRTTAAETVHLSNNNGGSTYGYALAVVDNGNYLGARVTVTGGTFDGPVALMDDATTNENCSLVITGGVFSDLANVVKYTTVTSDIDITLLNNTTVTETVRITSGQSITLDLNGKTVSSTLATTFRLEEGALNVVDTADVKGGISVSGEAFRVNGQGNSLATDAILNIGTGVKVTSSGDCCVFIYGKATLNTAGTLLSQGQYAPLMGNGTSASDGTVINITGGSITTDGTVTATGRKTTGVYFPQDGILTISGGTISSGGTAVEVKGGTVSITGGTIRTTAAETVHLSNNNGGSTYGYALAVVDNAGYSGATVTISGGTFDGPVALLDDDANVENNTSSLEITGGTFSNLVNVVKHTSEASNINIKLLNNVALTELIRVSSGQSITLDLNGKTISSALGTAFYLTKGTLNVVDNAVDKGGISVSGEAFRVNGTANASASDAVLDIGAGVNVTSSADCCVFIYGMATLNTAGNLTSNGVYAPIQGNGTGINDGTVINITGGKVIATLAGYHAIYVPQNVQMNISGGEISSAGTAIEAKGGTLTISSGTISTSASSTSHVPNSNGGSAVGYALAVIDNAGYSGALVTISGGAFNGPVALLDDDDNAGNNNSSLSITGGTFSSDPTH